VHGAAFGGGIGLAAACDLVLCSNDTKFSLSELRLGLVASCISPFIVKRIGEGRTKDLVFTARQFDGKQAEMYGLVTRSVPHAELESLVIEYVSMILKGSPKAREISKELIHQVAEGNITVYDSEKTAGLLADVRVSKEARERLEEFVGKKLLRR
jgi:methylglutaconyl-CoA hydratase